MRRIDTLPHIVSPQSLQQSLTMSNTRKHCSLANNYYNQTSQITLSYLSKYQTHLVPNHLTSPLRPHLSYTYTHKQAMAPSYPFPINTTTTPLNQNTTLHTSLAAPDLTLHTTSQNAEGTSISTVSVVGIVAGVVLLFSGLAWFAYHAFVTLPVRKKAVLKEKTKGRGRGV
jgi:hypothetical protein